MDKRSTASWLIPLLMVITGLTLIGGLPLYTTSICPNPGFCRSGPPLSVSKLYTFPMSWLWPASVTALILLVGGLGWLALIAVAAMYRARR